MSGNISVSYHCNRNVESTCHILLYENKPFWHSDSDFLNQLLQIALGFFFLYFLSHIDLMLSCLNLHINWTTWIPQCLFGLASTLSEMTEQDHFPTVLIRTSGICTHCIYSVFASLNNWMIITLMRWLFKKDVWLYIMNKLQLTKLFPCCVLLYNDKISLYWNVIQDKTEYKPHTVCITYRLMKSNICSPPMWTLTPGSAFWGQQKQPQFSVSDESEASASRAWRFRTFQCKHSARLSNQSYTRSWQQMEGTG